MQILFLLILGLLQGLCEFLPISSSGHLVLFSNIFGIEDSLFVSIILHGATLLAILVVFKKDVFYMVRHPFSKQSMSIVIATIPTALIVLVLMPLINQSFSEGDVILACSFLLSAIILIAIEYYSKKHKNEKEFTYKNAIIMGIAQGIAVFPGLSRSGTTISAGLFSGAGKESCAKFSFLMSIPVIILSMLLEIIKIFIYGETITVNLLGLLLAFIVAFIVGVLSIKLMIKLTTKVNFKWFSLYLIIISVVTLIIG